MSLRRAVELNYQYALQTAFQGSKYSIVGGVSNEERPSPVIIVIGGEGDSAFNDLSDSYGNYFVNLTILVISSIDLESVDEHNDAVDAVINTLNSATVKKKSLIDGLHIYDTIKLNVSEANDVENRKIGTACNYRAIVCYNN